MIGIKDQCFGVEIELTGITRAEAAEALAAYFETTPQRSYDNYDTGGMTMEKPLYFAYGSNINLEQMAHRCPDAQIVGPVTLENYELRFRGSGFATVTPKKGSVVHGLLWKLTPESERALDRYEGYPRHYTKEQVSVRTADGAAVSVMAYIMAEPMCRQPALPSPYYYRAIQQGFEANGLSVESLEEAWNRTIDEVWSGKVDRPQKRNKVKPKGQER